MKLFSRKAKVIEAPKPEVKVIKVIETKPEEYKAYLRRRWSGPTA